MNKKLSLMLLMLMFALMLASCDKLGSDDTTMTPPDFTTDETPYAHSHDYTSLVEDPTCTKQGYTTYTCACGDSYVDDYVDSLGHTEDSYIENEVDATCTDDGSHDYVVYCTVCKAELSRESITDDSTGHYEGSTVVENNVTATCTQIGSYDNVVYCLICESELSRENVVLGTKDHIEGAWIVDIGATVTENGKRHTECTQCGEKIREEVIHYTGTAGLKFVENSEGGYTVYGGTCRANTVIIPSIYNGKPVNKIGDYAFSGLANSDSSLYSMDKVIIPNSITSIGNYAFYNCYMLAEVTFEDGSNLETIGTNAFEECIRLLSITIPDSVTEIGNDAFHHCIALESLTIGSSVALIGKSAFEDCRSLTSVVIPDSVTLISSSAFAACISLTEITIPTSVTFIGAYGLGNCPQLTHIYYEGTIEQWNSIEKELDGYRWAWNEDSYSYAVYCSDGVLER